MNRAARFMEDWPSDDLRILSGASVETSTGALDDPLAR